MFNDCDLPTAREHIECDAPECSAQGPPKRCSRCHRAFYCSVACQRSHWKAGHKEECFDVNMIRDQVLDIGSKSSVSGGQIFFDAMQKMGQGDFVLGETETTSEEGGCNPKWSNTCCFICLSEPIEDPYTLPRCGHTFCFSCLQHWQSVAPKPPMFDPHGGTSQTKTKTKTQTQTQTQTTRKTCPACRAEAPDLCREVHETALLYAARASRGDKSREERNKYSEWIEKKKVQTLFTKAEVLQELERPTEAFEALEEIEAVDRRGRDNYTKIKSLLDSLEKAEQEYRTEAADRIVQQLEEMKANNANTSRLEHCGFDLYIKMAECLEAKKDYKEALDIYKSKIMAVMDYSDPETMGTPPQQRKMFMGMSRCMYHIANYELAISLGEAAIEMNRHFPQVHKYVALSQKASGDLDGAIRTMGRAVVYETPWDEANQKVVLDMYEEMKRES
eukprot:jgi/Psemu1/15609/gm1.15609_g